MKIHGVVLFLAVGSMAIASCTSASDAPTSTTESPAQMRVRCAAIGSNLIDELQTFVDGFASYSLADLPDGQVPGLTEIEVRIGQVRSDAEAGGCDMAAFATDLANSARGLEGRGPVGRPLAASLRGDPPSTEAEAVTRTIGVHDDLAGVLATAGPGSHITLETGIHEIDELLLIDRVITITGQERGGAILRSSAQDAAVMIPANGDLMMQNVTIQHVGESSASVMVAAGGDVHLEHVILSGGVTDETTGTDGHGLAVVSDVGAESSLALVMILSSRITGNAGVGIAVFGASTPTIENAVIAENGACGVCFFEDAGGSLSNSVIRRNLVGIGSSGSSHPMIESNTIDASGASGMVIGDDSAAEINDNYFTSNGASGIEISGKAGPILRSNAFTGSARSVVVADEARPHLQSNTFTKDEVAFSAAGNANPTLESNTFIESALASILVAENATGIIRGNVFVVADIGIQVAGTASPMITRNSFTGDKGIGVLYVEEGSGALEGNTYEGIANGIQIGDVAVVMVESETISKLTSAAVLVTGSARATLSDLTVDEATFGLFVDGEATADILASSIGAMESAGIVFKGSATGSVSDVVCSGGSSIILVEGASPDIGENDCSVSRQP